MHRYIMSIIIHPLVTYVNVGTLILPLVVGVLFREVGNIRSDNFNRPFNVLFFFLLLKTGSQCKTAKAINLAEGVATIYYRKCDPNVENTMIRYQVDWLLPDALFARWIVFLSNYPA